MGEQRCGLCKRGRRTKIFCGKEVLLHNLQGQECFCFWEASLLVRFPLRGCSEHIAPELWREDLQFSHSVGDKSLVWTSIKFNSLSLRWLPRDSVQVVHHERTSCHLEVMGHIWLLSPNPVV